MKGESYSEFVEKFKPKLTTDECYTPPVVYDAIRDYVNEHIFSLEGHRIVRPFFPGGDFEHFDYQPNDIVLNNPPFSILARIVKFYLSKKNKVLAVRTSRDIISLSTIQWCCMLRFLYTDSIS